MLTVLAALVGQLAGVDKEATTVWWTGIKWLMGYRSQARQSSTLGNGTAGYDWPMTMVLRAAIVSESTMRHFYPVMLTRSRPGSPV